LIVSSPTKQVAYQLEVISACLDIPYLMLFELRNLSDAKFTLTHCGVQEFTVD